MKIVCLLLCMCCVTSIELSAQSVPPLQEGNLFSLEVGNLVFQVDSAHGAKVSSLTVDGSEFLVTPDLVSTDYLWGATLWPSPQGDWNWNNPNKLIWDHGEYTASILGDTMRFTGKEVSVDNGDRFYFVKNFRANASDTTISLHYAMINTTGKTIKKGLWELSRVPVGGMTFWPTGPGGTWGALAPATEEINGHTWYYRESEDGTGLKFFADGKDGWYAHVDDNYRLYIKTFEDVDQSAFATGEGEIELWVDPEYIELENQGVCVNIANQDTLEYAVTWYLRQLPSNIDVIPGNQALVDYVNWIISGKGTPPVSMRPGRTNITLHCYPNPANHTLTVTLSGHQYDAFRYTLINMRGRVVLEGKLDSGTIDVSALPRGVCILQLLSETAWVSSRVVIE
ncbi:MAG: T9SS type A sorting domain-containing protein [Bacteroidota bacterium]